MLKEVSQNKMIIVFVEFTLPKLPPPRIKYLTIGSYHVNALVEYVMTKNRKDL